VRHVTRRTTAASCPIETPEGRTSASSRPVHLPGSRVRLHRDAVSRRQNSHGEQGDRVASPPWKRRARHRPGQRAVDAKGKFLQDVVIARSRRRFRHVALLDVTLMESRRTSWVSVCRLPHPVPGARRREPRPHGFQTCSARRSPSCAPKPPFVGTGMEAVVRTGLRSGRGGPARRHGRNPSMPDGSSSAPRNPTPPGSTGRTSTRW